MIQNVYFHPYYPNHYLWTSIEFTDSNTAETWNGMNTTLRHFLHAIFEAVDVLTGVLLDQVPEDFETLHRLSVHHSYLKLPHDYPRQLYTKRDKEEKEKEKKEKDQKESKTVKETEKERKTDFDPVHQDKFMYTNIKRNEQKSLGCSFPANTGNS